LAELALNHITNKGLANVKEMSLRLKEMQIYGCTVDSAAQQTFQLCWHFGVQKRRYRRRKINSL